MNATVCSGDGVRTTFGNTNRTLSYAWYYIQEAGICDEPWKENDKAYTIASGDDFVIFVAARYAQQLKDTIERLTARNTNPQVVGLAQVIKSVEIRPWQDFDFCSKKPWAPDGTFNTW